MDMQHCGFERHETKKKNPKLAPSGCLHAHDIPKAESWKKNKSTGNRCYLTTMSSPLMTWLTGELNLRFPGHLWIHFQNQWDHITNKTGPTYVCRYSLLLAAEMWNLKFVSLVLPVCHIYGSDNPKYQTGAQAIVLPHKLWLLTDCGCFQWTQKDSLHEFFFQFLTASHKYVSGYEPQAIQNIQDCFIKSCYDFLFATDIEQFSFSLTCNPENGVCAVYKTFFLPLNLRDL